MKDMMLNKLEKTYQFLAECVVHGDALMPLFLRAEEELTKERQKSDALNRARQAALSVPVILKAQARKRSADESPTSLLMSTHRHNAHAVLFS